MNIPTTIAPSATPGAIEGFAIKPYLGSEELKLKAVDKATGASWTCAVLHLHQHLKTDPMRVQVAQDFAAMAIAAPRLMEAAKMLLDMVGTEDGHVALQREEIRALFAEPVRIARHEQALDLDVSPAVVAYLEKKKGK